MSFLATPIYFFIAGLYSTCEMLLYLHIHLVEFPVTILNRYTLNVLVQDLPRMIDTLNSFSGKPRNVGAESRGKNI